MEAGTSVAGLRTPFLLLILFSLLSLSKIQCELVQHLEISESAPTGSRVGFIDAESPPFLIVPVPGSPVKTDLIVDPSTGEIRTKVALDRETRPSYSLVALPQNVRVVIKVLDENDNAPTFPVDHIHVEFPENSPRDSKRALPPAKDPDLGQYSTQRYEIINGNNGDIFRLSQHRGRDGVLYLDLQNSGTLDREAKSSYQLIIEALDGGMPPLRSRLRVNVTVQDVNDNPPIFNQTRYTANIPENSTVGYPVIVVNATDTDAGANGRIEYSINRRQSDRDEMFRIDGESGMIFVNKPLDFEAKERHELVIVARDLGAQPLEASAFLSIYVTDVNDNQPAITVIFLSDDATPKISESAQPGEFVARISVSDPDSRTEYSNATVTLSGGSGHFGLATRDNIIYLVVVERPLDREEKSIYELSVEATDTGTPPLRAIRTFRLLVTDVNDNAPTFVEEKYEAHLLEASEPGTPVLRVKATDADEGMNSAIKYSLKNTSWFKIDEDSGLISTVTHVDCETDPTPILIAIATDSGRPSLSGSAIVRITVHDLNDNEPIFERPLYNATVAENLSIGSCFTKGPSPALSRAPSAPSSRASSVAGDVDTGSVKSDVSTSSPEKTTSRPQGLDQKTLDSTAKDRYLALIPRRKNPNHAGTQGRRIKVETNMLSIIFKRDFQVSVTHYDVKFNPDRPKFLKKLAFAKLQSGHFHRNYPAFDGRGNVYAAGDLPFGRELSTKVTVFDEERQQDREVQVTMKKVNSINISWLPNVKPGLKETDRDQIAMQVIDVIMRTASFDRSTQTGRSFFSQPQSAISLGSGMELWSGLFQSAVLGWKPYFNVDVAVKAFPKPQSVLTTMKELCSTYRAECRELTAHIVEQNRSKIESYFRTLKVIYQLPGKPSTIRTVGVNGLGESARKKTFQLDNGEVTTVLKYFQDTKKYNIQHPDLPCLWVGPSTKHNFVPAELCQVVGGLVTTKKLDENQTRGMIREVTKDTQTRKTRIKEAFQAMGFNEHPTIKEFGISINPQFETVDARVLNPPTLHQNRREITPAKGVWRANQFRNTLGLEEGSWTILNLSRVRDDVLYHFVDKLREQGKCNGMQIDRPRTPFKTMRAPGKDIRELQQCLQELKMTKLKLIFVVIPGQGQHVYPKVKQVAELTVGCLTQCIKDLTINKFNPMTAGNILLKVNCKLNGVNHTLQVNSKLECLRRPCIIFGADVTHPSPDATGIPSIAAVAASQDVTAFRYNIVVQLQPPRQEIILQLEQIVYSQIRIFEEKNNCKPEKIFFYRDGVSEGQFPQVMHVELQAMRNACKKLGPTYQPKITFLVVQKRHHIRFFPTDRKNSDDRNGNVQAGTVVDTNITHPSHIDFYLVSHASIQVQATDPDCGINSMVNYTLTTAGRLASEQLFVRSDTGEICVRSPLDREVAPYLELPVIATDRGGLSTTAIVRVTVNDVNDNRPIFNPLEYNTTIRADSPSTGTILKLLAKDLDAGLFGQISYRIISGNEGGVFRIDRTTGELQVARPSLLSRSALHQLNVTATDAAGLKSTLDASIRIAVSMGQHLPICQKPRYVISAKENVLQNSIIGDIKESNESTSGSRASKFFLATGGHDFSIDPNSGVLRTRISFDRELKGQYILSVGVRNDIGIGYCQVELNIDDINDNPPSFATANVRISVAESHPLHTALYVAQANDPDVIPSTSIRYILVQNSNDLFGIDTHNGQLYLIRRLDYETQQRHTLLISALDGGGLSANLSLSVEVQDVNDNPPVFERNEYHVEIPEGAKLDSQVLQVTALDLDTGNNARISYRLQGSSSFRISPNTGWIYLTQTLDRETTDRYALTVLATDNGSPAATATSSVLVTVLDDNDNSPRFDKDFYSFQLFENLPSGTLVGTVTASDPDRGKNSLLRYAVVQHNSSFAIDPDTGEIITREPLDRELRSIHELVLEARDHGSPSKAARVPLRVSVLDVNDNSPEIVDPQGDVVSVREEQPVGTEVARVRGLDADVGENATITYSILKDRDSDGYNVFTIDPITGMIRTKYVLDHEERDVYRVSVKASDAGRPPRHSIRVLRVEVLALADNRPTFTSSSLTFHVREDASIGQAVGSVSGAGPAGRVAYTLTSLTPQTQHPAFDVDRSSGQIVVAHSLDRENVSEYHLDVRALDTTSIGNPQSIAVSVKIFIDDANDNPPKWPQDPIFIRVSESCAIGVTIYNLTATDDDNGANGDLRYNLVSEFPVSGIFAVDSLTGALTIMKMVDREERSEYTLLLRATDGAAVAERLATTVTAKVAVLDQNDNDPIFIAPNSTRLSVTPDLLPGANIVRVIAVDRDADNNGRVSYVITSGNEDSSFSVGYESGLVTLIRPLLKDTILQITANDHGSPPHRAILNLTISMAIGQTNGPPRLLQHNPIVRVSEHLRIGGAILNVAGPALGHHVNVSFHIPNGVGSNKFSISPSGLVTLTEALDRESMEHYHVPILAKSNKLLDITTLEIVVEDENDNTPEFRSGACYTLAVPENQEISIIHTIAAVDLDDGNNGAIVYNIIGGNDGGKFRLDPATGDLSAASLDCETVARYILTISAKDKGHPSLEAHCNMSIIVLDVNDNSPTFTPNQRDTLRLTKSSEYPSFTQSFHQYYPNYSGKYSSSISEDVPADSSVMTVRATDPDQGFNGKITYTISEETTWLFRVDNLTGVITTAGQLDRERQATYNFLVIATDGGLYEAKSTSIPVEINLNDVNDNAPVFEMNPFRARVSTSTQPGHNILQVKANDYDAGINGDIIYSFSHEDDKPKFRIHPMSGVITATTSLIKDYGKTFHLAVIARDRGNPPRNSTALIELKIGDADDLNPILMFQNNTYEAVVQENSPFDMEIIRVTAVRSDGRRQHMSYSIATGNEYETFIIDEESGTVKINDPSMLDAELWMNFGDSDQVGQRNLWERNSDNQLSRENPREASTRVLTLIARTTGPDPLKAYATLIIRISDVNDNPPIFTQSQYSATVLEGNAKGNFVAKLSASDADQGINSKILYHIVDGNPDNAFTISPPYSGVVRTNIVLDREIREKYRLTIIATDQGNPQLTGTTALSIRVIDVNDNQPTFPGHNVISIPEDTSVGAVLTTMTANDVDSSPALTYRFGKITETIPFSIDRYGGKVILREPLDAEEHYEYSLQVMASDGIHEATTELIVRLTDVNDNGPIFHQTAYVTTLSEGTDTLEEIVVVNATDDDVLEVNKMIHYYLLSSVEGFTINPDTGAVIANKTALTRPLAKEIELTVVARDSGKPSLSSNCTVIVRLSGLRRSSSSKEFQFNVTENATRGTTILKLTDIGLLDGIIMTGDDGTFEISRGDLMVIKNLDRETRGRYILQLGSKASNTTSDSLATSDLIQISLEITDVNDNYPIFVEKTHQVSIPEDSSPGTILLTVSATDNDLANSPASTITYSITSGNDVGLFTVNSTTGRIFVNSTLDCDLSPETYNLIVLACDNDPNPLCALAKVEINLEDVNDNSPKFAVSEYLEFVGENEAIGTRVFSAMASDLDRGIFGSVNYSIVSAAASGFSEIDDSWKLFKIEPITGSITTRSIFDYEQRNRYAFTLKATDTGGRTAEVRVRIEIESRDEFYPQFTERMYKFIVRNSQTQAGSIIGHVTATDRDKGPDGRVVYQLTSQHPYFKLNRTTGTLILKKKLHFDTIEESSRLVVSASSGRQGSLSNMTVVEIRFVDNHEDDNNNNIYNGGNSIATPSNLGANMAMATSSGLADWALGLLIALVLLIASFGAIFLFLHFRSKKMKNNIKPGLNGESNATSSNSYVDPSAFDTIPIRSVANVGNGSNVGGSNSAGGTCQFAPPKYDEIPPYGTSSQGQQATSEISGSEQSGSSGRGSAEDDGEDEEIRMINEGQTTDSASDLSVHNTQEYLARLGIVDPPSGTPRRPPEALPLDSLHLFEDEAVTEAEIATLIYGKIGNESGGPASGLGVPGGPSMNGSLSSIVHSEEELTGSYNWDYLLDWGPQYQPLAHVFGEIARLKDDAASFHSTNSGGSARLKSVHKAPPPPLLTSVAPRSIAAPALARGMLPRSPISHDTSTFPSAALSPSFSPSLSPLATRSPSISPLVPATAPRQGGSRIPIVDNELRI